MTKKILTVFFSLGYGVHDKNDWTNVVLASSDNERAIVCNWRS